MSTTARLRSLVTNVTLAGGATVIALAIVEVALRVTGLVPAVGVHTVTEREFHEVPGIFSPNQTVQVRQIRELPHAVEINSLGYRGEDFPLAKPRGEFRIVAVGDSFTYGAHVDDDETLPARLEDDLRRRCQNLRVVNAGLGGTTIVGQSHIAERSLAVSPDLVVLMFYENDIINLAGPGVWRELERNRQLKSRFPYSVAYGLVRSMALFDLFTHTRGFLRVQLEREQGTSENPGAKRELQHSLRPGYLARLTALRDSLAALGIPLVVTGFPSHLTIRGAGQWEQLEWLKTELARLHIPYVDIATRLATSGIGADRLYLLPWDGHASPLGYAFGARVLAEGLASKRLLGKACGTEVKAAQLEPTRLTSRERRSAAPSQGAN